MIFEESFTKWYESHLAEIERDFFTFLRFRSVSTDPSCRKEILQTADWLASYLQKSGLRAEKLETTGYPVVFASFDKAGPNRPTLLLYHHYDVQPVDPIEEWLSPPFEPTVRAGQIYARGAVDNKGQCFYSLVAARAWIEIAEKKGINLKIFIEGEEESGSLGTEQALEKYREKLRADFVLVVDSGIPSLSSPAITVGMRGLMNCEVECSNARIDLHSGEHGGIALNPNRVLASLLSSLWDEKGKVSLPGFYDEINPLEKEVLSQLDFSFDREEYEKSFGVHAFCPEPGYGIQESNRLRPTLEINGMSGGYTGPGVKTVIPAKAFAKISCRLVPDQDPEKIFSLLKEHFIKYAPSGIRVRVHGYSGAKAYRAPLKGSFLKTIQRAYEKIFKQNCLLLFSGASIPIINKLSLATQGEGIAMGMGLVTDAIHSPNEHFGWDRFKLGYLTIGEILHSMGAEA